MINSIPKVFLIVCIISAIGAPSSAQQLHSNAGKVVFAVNAPAKTITAESTSGEAILDFVTGVAKLKVPVSSFRFNSNFDSDSLNGRLHERFNNHYLESKSFPIVLFEGKISNLQDIDHVRPGTYPVRIDGHLTMHGRTREIVSSGTLIVQSKAITLKVSTKVAPGHFDINVPAYVSGFYFKQVEVTYSGIFSK